MGTVQLHPAWEAAARVRLRGRRTGLGTQLMHTIEDAARRAGCRLLTLDTKRGDAAEHLYRQLGWTPRDEKGMPSIPTAPRMTR